MAAIDSISSEQPNSPKYINTVCVLVVAIVAKLQMQRLPLEATIFHSQVLFALVYGKFVLKRT